MSHYIDLHLEDKSIDTVILHAGVNDLLNDNSQSNVNNLMSNIYKIKEKCKRVGVRNSFVFGLVYTTRVSLPILGRVHNLSQLFTRSFEKKRIAWGNQALFMTKEFQKAIYTKSRLKNKTNENPTTIKNMTAFKRQRNYCVSLRRKNIKSFHGNITKRGITMKKSF